MKNRWKAASTSFWDYEYFMPKGRYKRFNVGNTRLIGSRDYDRLFFKMEIDNPTKSFKDRGSVIEVQKAMEYGYREIACASTGNMAYSISHFAHELGMRTKVFIGTGANPTKVRDIISTKSASIEKVNGDFNVAFRKAFEYSRKNNAFIAGDYGYRMEGQKTVAYEIIKEMQNIENIIIPVGNATLISGIFKALSELKEMRVIKKYPRLICVQAEKCNPLVRAFNTGSRIRYRKPNTQADAIAVGLPLFGDLGIEAIKNTDGLAVSVSEKEMHAEMKNFRKETGMTAEMAGVAGIAAYKRLMPNGITVAIISGGNL